MDKYFVDGYKVKRYIEDSGGWGDGDGVWETIGTISGHMRVLGASERSDMGELVTTHRLYTRDKDIMYGDIIEKDGAKYDVKLVDHKAIPTSDMDFVQVDCEMII